MIREARRRYLNCVGAARDADIYVRSPLRPEELAILSIQSCLPVEDWSDWTDAHFDTDTERIDMN